MNISEKIKKVIKDKGVKDNEFALTTGIAIDRVRNLCQGKVKKLQPHEKDAICNAYSVRPQWWENDSVPQYMTEGELIFLPGNKKPSAERLLTKAPVVQESPAPQYHPSDTGAHLDQIDVPLLTKLIEEMDRATVLTGSAIPATDKGEMIARSYADITAAMSHHESRLDAARVAGGFFERIAALYKGDAQRNQ